MLTGLGQYIFGFFMFVITVLVVSNISYGLSLISCQFKRIGTCTLQCPDSICCQVKVSTSGPLPPWKLKTPVGVSECVAIPNRPLC